MTVIISDSTSDLSKEHQQQLGVTLAPLLVNFADGSYRDGVDLSIDEFYQNLHSCEQLPTTSQVNPVDFEALFRSCLDRGDDIVGVFLSSELSGTYQSAMVAKAAIGSDRIHIVDSLNATIGMGLLIKIACGLRDQGVGAAEIAKQLDALKTRLRLIVTLDTLKYLHMGGRLSTASAIVGNMLGITPVISVIKGKVEAIGKVRGKKQSFDFVLKQIAQDPPDEAYPKTLGHADESEKFASFLEYLAPHVDLDNAMMGRMGCVIGAHLGPGAVGIAYIAK